MLGQGEGNPEVIDSSVGFSNEMLLAVLYVSLTSRHSHGGEPESVGTWLPDKHSSNSRSTGIRAASGASGTADWTRGISHARIC
jgi:hypothetical protein